MGDEPDRPGEMASRYRSPTVAMNALAILLTLAGLALSGFLTDKGFQTDVTLPGCGRGSGCEKVLTSSWSKIFGLPTALPAALIYADMLFIVLLLRGRRSPGMFRLLWLVLVIEACLILSAAAYFSFVQYAVIGAFCKYCMATHGVGVVLSLLILFNAPVGRRKLLPEDPPDPLMIAPPVAAVAALLSFMLIGGVAALQFATRPPTFRVHFMGDAVAFDMYKVPHIGNVEAPNKMVMLFDYACPHCQAVHGMLDGVHGHFGDQLAIVLLPHPLNSKCNPTIEHTEPRFDQSCELARIGLAVWENDPTFFDGFNTWMFESDEPRTVEEAKDRASSNLKSNIGEEMLNSDFVNETLNLALQFQQAAMDKYRTDPGLPKIYVNGIFIEGYPATESELIELLNQAIAQTTQP